MEASEFRCHAYEHLAVSHQAGVGVRLRHHVPRGAGGLVRGYVQVPGARCDGPSASFPDEYPHIRPVRRRLFQDHIRGCRAKRRPPLSVLSRRETTAMRDPSGDQAAAGCGASEYSLILTATVVSSA